MKRKPCPHGYSPLRCYHCKKAKGKVAHGRKEIEKLTKSKLKKDFDTVYAFYIRLRDCDERGYGACISCGRVLHYSKLQNGHYMSRKEAPGLIFNEMNTHAQCFVCNKPKEGNKIKYRIAIAKRYGEEQIKLLESMVNHKSGFTAVTYQYLIGQYICKLMKERKRTGAQLSKAVLNVIARHEKTNKPETT